MKDEKFEEEIRKPSKKSMIAKKDWELCCNEVNVSIKKGDDVSKMVKSEKLIECLRKEKVL